MLQLGLVGQHISYSKSPLIHNYWLESYGLAGYYKLYDLTKPEVLLFVETFFQNHMAGVNVTIPYKSLLYNKMDEVSDLAKKAQAINTIVCNEGKLSGFNTDILGCLDLFTPLSPQIVCIFGYGGVAQGIIVALKELRCPDIRVVCRQLPDARDPQITYYSWSDYNQALERADIIINASPLGLNGQGCPLPHPQHYIKYATYMDCVYHPMITPFLENAREAGANCINGLDLLLRQAQYSFKLWTGYFPDITDDLRTKLATLG